MKHDEDEDEEALAEKHSLPPVGPSAAHKGSISRPAQTRPCVQDRPVGTTQEQEVL